MQISLVAVGWFCICLFYFEGRKTSRFLESYSDLILPYQPSHLHSYQQSCPEEYYFKHVSCNSPCFRVLHQTLSILTGDGCLHVGMLIVWIWIQFGLPHVFYYLIRRTMSQCLPSQIGANVFKLRSLQSISVLRKSTGLLIPSLFG